MNFFFAMKSNLFGEVKSHLVKQKQLILKLPLKARSLRAHNNALNVPSKY